MKISLFPLFLFASLSTFGSAQDTLMSCKSDRDCAVLSISRESSKDPTSYCAQGVCKDYGSCTVDLDCYNPANTFMYAACAGYLECQEGECAMVCDETGNQCKDGSTFAQCESMPCSTNKCEASVSCVNNYCGGCGATFFDATGNEVCSGVFETTEEIDGEPTETTPDEDDEDELNSEGLRHKASFLGALLGSAFFLNLWS